jgi:hypothetical protein
MNDDADYSIILFQSVNHTLWAQKLLKKEGCRSKMIPIPRNISSDCGVCIRIPSEAVAVARATLHSIKDPWRIVQLNTTHDS